MKIIKILTNNWLVLLIGFILLSFFEIRLFLFYFFIINLIQSEVRMDYIRKIIRVFQLWNEVKLISILKKLWVADKDLKKIGKEIEDSLTIKQRRSLEDDIKGSM